MNFCDGRSRSEIGNSKFYLESVNGAIEFESRGKVSVETLWKMYRASFEKFRNENKDDDISQTENIDNN